MLVVKSGTYEFHSLDQLRQGHRRRSIGEYQCCIWRLDGLRGLQAWRGWMRREWWGWGWCWFWRRSYWWMLIGVWFCLAIVVELGDWSFRMLRSWTAKGSEMIRMINELNWYRAELPSSYTFFQCTLWHLVQAIMRKSWVGPNMMSIDELSWYLETDDDDM